MTGEAAFEESAARALTSFSKTVARNPAAHTQMMAAVDFAVGPSFEIVVAGEPQAEATVALLRAFQGRYLPHKVLLLRPPGEHPITKLAPFTREQEARDTSLAYVCRDFACQAPTSDAQQALALLDRNAREGDTARAGPRTGYGVVGPTLGPSIGEATQLVRAKSLQDDHPRVPRDSAADRSGA